MIFLMFETQVCVYNYNRYYIVLGSIAVSISACHADDPGSIPGPRVIFNLPDMFGISLVCFLSTSETVNVWESVGK